MVPRFGSCFSHSRKKTLRFDVFCHFETAKIRTFIESSSNDPYAFPWRQASRLQRWQVQQVQHRWPTRPKGPPSQINTSTVNPADQLSSICTFYPLSRFLIFLDIVPHLRRQRHLSAKSPQNPTSCVCAAAPPSKSVS